MFDRNSCPEGNKIITDLCSAVERTAGQPDEEQINYTDPIRLTITCVGNIRTSEILDVISFFVKLVSALA